MVANVVNSHPSSSFNFMSPLLSWSCITYNCGVSIYSIFFLSVGSGCKSFKFQLEESFWLGIFHYLARFHEMFFWHCFRSLGTKFTYLFVCSLHYLCTESSERIICKHCDLPLGGILFVLSSGESKITFLLSINRYVCLYGSNNDLRFIFLCL